jgi:hypothetical protein
MMRIALLLGLLAVAGVAGAAAQQAPGEIVNEEATAERTVVHLRGLDTLDGTVENIDATAGQPVRFRHLEILVDTCRVPVEDPEGDASVHLTIRDIREEAPRFVGWMFASSPALSALDHPRYDVWVLSCSNR